MLPNVVLPNAAKYYEHQTGENLGYVDRTPLNEKVNNYGLAGSAALDALKFYNTLEGNVPDLAYQNVVTENTRKRARWERLGLTPQNIRRVAAVGGALSLATIGATVAAGALNPSLISGAVGLVNDYIIKGGIKPAADFISTQADKGYDMYKSDILKPLRNKVSSPGILEVHKNTPSGPIANAVGGLKDQFGAASTRLQSQANIIPTGLSGGAEATRSQLLQQSRGAEIISQRLGESLKPTYGGGPVFDLARGVMKLFGAGTNKANEYAVRATNNLGRVATPFFGEKYLGTAALKIKSEGQYSDAARFAGLGAAGLGGYLLLRPFQRITDTYRMMFPTKSTGPLRKADERNINEKMKFASGKDRDALKLAKLSLTQREHALAATANNISLTRKTLPSLERFVQTT